MVREIVFQPDADPENISYFTLVFDKPITGGNAFKSTLTFNQWVGKRATLSSIAH